jgi:hypothetical protein
VIYLEKAVELIGSFHAECRRNAVAPETAAKAMGFNTVHGGVLTTFAGLREYGLIDRPGGKVALTPLAVKILHPISDSQRLVALQEAALLPRVFKELLNDFADCSQGVLESHLVQQNFAPDRAKQVARVFIANKAFAKLESSSNFDVTEYGDKDSAAQEKPADAPKLSPDERPVRTAQEIQSAPESSHPTHVVTQKGNVLAQYSIPLGENVATLVFTGARLTADDFDALEEYVGLFKKQFIRAQAGVAAAKAAFAAPIVAEVPPTREVMDDLTTYHGPNVGGVPQSPRVVRPNE